MNQTLLFQQEPYTHHSALASIKLAIYAADAMRVLRKVEQHVERSQGFEAALRAACPDWRNPGSLEEPEDLIVSVLTHAVGVLEELLDEPALLPLARCA